MDDMATIQVGQPSLPGSLSIAGSTYNSDAATIHTLPPEILLQIFSGVIPNRNDHMASIRLTHVCHLWRTLIRGGLAFWLGILDPAKKTAFTSDPTRYPIVLEAFEKSQPVTQLAFSLHGAFLPTLSTLPEHVSRITTLWLDSSHHIGLESIRQFVGLHIAQLEKLTLWCYCSSADLSTHIAVDTFPRLRYLRTNCMQLASRWVTPALRTLILGARARGSETSEPGPSVCCLFPTFAELLESLRRCPDIEELDIHYTLRDTGLYGIRDPQIYLRKLKVFHLGAIEDVIWGTLKLLTFPDTTRITLCSVDTFDQELVDLLPYRHHRTLISPIRSLAIYIGSERIPEHWGSVDCENETGDRLLSLHSGDFSFVNSDYDFCLELFFEHAMMYFSPSQITRLKVDCFTILRDDGEGWSWLFRFHLQITELVLDVNARTDGPKIGPEVALTALAPADVMVHLQHLTVVMSVYQTSAKAHNAMVSVLEQRAARGLRLRSLTFIQEVDPKQVGLRYALNDDQVARLKAVVDELSLTTWILD